MKEAIFIEDLMRSCTGNERLIHEIQIKLKTLDTIEVLDNGRWQKHDTDKPL